MLIFFNLLWACIKSDVDQIHEFIHGSYRLIAVIGVIEIEINVVEENNSHDAHCESSCKLNVISNIMKCLPDIICLRYQSKCKRLGYPCC